MARNLSLLKRFFTFMEPAVFLQTAALCCYALLGTYSFGFPRPTYSFLAAILTPVVVNLMLTRIIEGRFRWAPGSLIAGISFYLLLESPYSVLPYIFGGVVSQSSKFIFRNEGQQIFNPSNLALLVTLYCVPTFVAFVPDQWNSSLEVVSFVYLAGLSVCYFAKRIPLALAYLAAFAVFSFIRCQVTGGSFLFFCGTAIGVPQAIFTFHMITDPKSSPSGFHNQIIFGVFIGILDVILRWNLFLYPPILALVIACALRPIVQKVMHERKTLTTAQA